MKTEKAFLMRQRKHKNTIYKDVMTSLAPPENLPNNNTFFKFTPLAPRQPLPPCHGSFFRRRQKEFVPTQNPGKIFSWMLILNL